MLRTYFAQTRTIYYNYVVEHVSAALTDHNPAYLAVDPRGGTPDPLTGFWTTIFVE
jgi:hypothetical protein